ncbi:MAG: hypothetical protein R3C45_17375 [Phycisphaerales bacterium]
MLKTAVTSSLLLMLVSGVACADPTLPDWTAATFGPNSADITNPYLSFSTNTFSTYEGEVEEGVERIEILATQQTKTILGVETRVVRDMAYIDGVLVEIAYDWYAQDTSGNVWYFGEDVLNYNYDAGGNFIGTDTGGSWIADGVTTLPGMQMFAAPSVGDEYFQEWAPGVAFDFAEVVSLTGTVDIDFGTFTGNVLVTGEGNIFDDPEPNRREQAVRTGRSLGADPGAGRRGRGWVRDPFDMPETGPRAGNAVPGWVGVLLFVASALTCRP